MGYMHATHMSPVGGKRGWKGGGEGAGRGSHIVYIVY